MHTSGSRWLLRTLVPAVALGLLALGPMGCADDGGDGDGDGQGDGSGDGDGDGDDGADPQAGEVPDDPDYCASVADWDSGWAQLEEDVLEIVNEVRAQGADCGAQGSFDPAPPMKMNGRLRCAARAHTADMVDRGYFDHYSPEGASPGDRVDAAEYVWSTWGENIAGGSPDAAGTMEQWMNSDGHCSNIMNPAFEEIGVAYVAGGQYGHTWTQVFGAPR